MKLLEGKTAIITGASRGIGKAVALEFARQGANIAFTDLRYDEIAQETEKEIVRHDEIADIHHYILCPVRQGFV